MRDWIWGAVEELPPQLRLVLMLRHFSGITSYQEIAAACEVPVGTVRSRLNQARGKMARVLLSTATQTHCDASVLTEESRHEAVATLRASEHGTLPREISELWPTETELVGTLSRPGERIHPVPVMRQILEAGVRQHLRHVVASRDIAIWEMDVTNPIGAINPCPPTLAWLMFRSPVQQGRPGPHRREALPRPRLRLRHHLWAVFGDHCWVPDTNGADFLVFCVRWIASRPSVAWRTARRMCPRICGTGYVNTRARGSNGRVAECAIDKKCRLRIRWLLSSERTAL
ncbi:RNA polymerase sigma factor [Streptomyces avermitilis]|nr:sigma factor-like helix-turn-helix DNA-binding protein [Streptomyces avermitilis]